MAPQLKQFWVGIILLFFGLILFVGGLIFNVYIHPDYLFFVPMALSGGIGLIIFGFLCIRSIETGKIRFIFRWCKLGLGKSDGFPQNKYEKEALVKSGWPAMILRRHANGASKSFGIRDHRMERLEIEVKKGIGRAKHPKELIKSRGHYNKCLESLQDSLMRAKAEAQAWHQSYLKHWDFFKDMGMLPIDKKTGIPWNDLEFFRKALIADLELLKKSAYLEPHLSVLNDYAATLELFDVALLDKESANHLKNCCYCLNEVNSLRTVN